MLKGLTDLPPGRSDPCTTSVNDVVMKLHNQIFIAMGLAVAAGMWAPELVAHIHWIGKVFLSALKMVIGPLILASVVVGVMSLGDVREAGRIGAKTVTYFLSTTFIAVIIGLGLVNLIQPGDGADLATLTAGNITLAATEMGVGTFLANLATSVFMNPFAALAQGKVLSVIAFALLLGGVLTTLGDRGKPVGDFFESFNDAMMGIVGVILKFTPIGVFALVANITATNGPEVFVGLAKYVATVILALALHGLILLFVVLPIFGRISPKRMLAGMRAAYAMAFSTASSSATLPMTMRCAEEGVGVSRRSVRFVLPLGATVNMDGTALYEAVAAMFIAQAYGIHLGLGAQIIIFITATTAAIGAAGTPGAGLVTMSMVFTAVGLPLEGIGMILAVDRVLDMCRTCVNVVGDSVGTVVVARMEGLPLHEGDPDGHNPNL